MNQNGVSTKEGENTKNESKVDKVVTKVVTSPANLGSENKVLMAKAYTTEVTTYKAYIIINLVKLEP